MSGNVALTNTSSTSVTLHVDAVTSDTIILSYDTFPGNQPNAYGNTAFLWENSGIPWNQPPLQADVIPTNTQAGLVVISDLEVTNSAWMIGYAVGPEVDRICATASIPAVGGGPTTYFSTSITLLAVTADSVVVQYATPAGYDPAAYGNWVGLWQDSFASYTNPPLAKAMVTSSSNTGTVVLTGVQIQPGATYSVGYFMGEAQTTLGANLTFGV